MKYNRFILLFFAIASIHQFNYSAQQSAYRLTQESYISPEMQWAILSFLGAKDVTINTRTGNVANIPPADALLGEVRRRLQGSINFAAKESMKNALHAILEATDIAIFVAAVEAAHHDQKYVFYQNIDAQLAIALDAQKKDILAALADLNARDVFDEPVKSSSYFSWFYPTIAEMDNPGHVPSVTFNDNQETITFSKDMMEAIIKKNNYKIEKKSDAKKAANTLFKQCFIAQQHHLKDATRIEKLKIKFENPLKPENYFFQAFPDIDRACDIVKSIVPSHQTRYNIQAPITQEQRIAHQLLLDIRQAIQTAMYIANDKSSYNVGYVLPTSVASYLGGIVIELTTYDAKLSMLCKEPQFGATPDDTYRDEQWSMISKIAAGTLTAAVVAGTIYFFAPAAAVSAVTSGASSLASGVSSLWSSQPVLGPDGKPILPADKSTLEQVRGAATTIGNYGDKAFKVGTIAALGTTGLKAADKAGYISLNEIDPNARYYVDIAQKVAVGTTVVGGAGKAIGGFENSVKGVTNSWNNPQNDSKTLSGKFWNGVDVAFSAKGVTDAAQYTAAAVGGAAAIARSTAAQFTGIQDNQTIQNNQQPKSLNQPVSTQTNQISPQALANGFAKVIAEGKTPEGLEPIQKIANISQSLLVKNQTNPATLIQVLQYVQENNQSNPVIAEQLGQLKQAVIGLQNQTLQPAQPIQQ